MSYGYDHNRAWKVVRWMRWEHLDLDTDKYVRDPEPTPGVIYVGDEDAARHIYERYAEAGEPVELRHQPPPTIHPEEVVASTVPDQSAEPLT